MLKIKVNILALKAPVSTNDSSDDSLYVHVIKGHFEVDKPKVRSHRWNRPNLFTFYWTPGI